MAPIDPLQLLRALSPLLSTDGGIRSVDEVVRLSSLMKKFSRKLVSRCVYVNVLRASESDAVEAFLMKGGWETIHTWLQETKKSDNHPFLVELLKLYKTLPMTVERLKENSSAKIIKTLTKSGQDEIKALATDVVNSWVKLVKGEPNAAADKDDKLVKKKKKKEEKKDGKHEKDKEKDKEKDREKDGKEKKDAKDEPRREKKGSKDAKSPKSAKENNKVTTMKGDELEDVKLPDYILNPEPKEMKKPERKSTVKTYRAKFRSIGLEEATPLPKPITKKPTADKTGALPLMKNSKRIGPTLGKDLLPASKKPKPPNLILPKSEPEKLIKLEPDTSPPIIGGPMLKTDLERREIKLIAARSKPVHVLTESAGFMDALVAGPMTPIRKKKKPAPNKSPTTPPSPTTTLPKLQFYKDTLESQEEAETTDSGENKEPSGESSMEIEDIKDVKDIELLDDDKPTISSPDIKEDENISNCSETSSSLASNKKKKKRKSVTWAEESNLKQVFFFELDETERVNVNNLKNFGDLSTLERLKERQVVESARRMQGDTMEEKMAWLGLIPIDLPAALVNYGCNSAERGIQKAREESVLQEIFFSKESLPDAPHEPDPETYDPEEPKPIPLEDENNPDAFEDYSMMEPQVPVSTLPPALSSLVMSISGKHSGFGPQNPPPMDMQDMGMMNNDPQMGHHNFNAQGPPMMGAVNHGMMGMGPPPGFDSMGGYPGDYGPGHDFGPTPFEQMPPNMMDGGMDYYDGGMPCPDMPPAPLMGMQQGGGPMRHSGPNRRGNRGRPGHNRGRGNMMGPHSRGMSNNRDRNGGGGQRLGRGSGGGRSTCRHFMMGTCKYEESCIFLHPGVNGPPL